MAGMIQQTTGAPAQDVTITIAGATYSLRFGLLAEYTMDSLKLDLRQFVNAVALKSAGNFSNFIKLFSAMVSHQFYAAHQPIPEPEHWMVLIESLPEAERQPKLRELCQKVWDVYDAWRLSKLEASAQTGLQEPAPNQGPTLN